MKKGFTLLELLIVVVVLGIITLIALPTMLNAIRDTKDSVVISNTKVIEASLAANLALNKSLTDNEIVINTINTLNNDVKNPYNPTQSAYRTSGSASGSVVVSVNGDQIDLIGYGESAGEELISKQIPLTFN